MSKVIKISDEYYEILRKVSFKNRVSIQHLANAVMNAGIEKCKNDKIPVKYRGQSVEIEW